MALVIERLIFNRVQVDSKKKVLKMVSEERQKQLDRMATNKAQKSHFTMLGNVSLGVRLRRNRNL